MRAMEKQRRGNQEDLEVKLAEELRRGATFRVKEQRELAQRGTGSRTKTLIECRVQKRREEKGRRSVEDVRIRRS